MNEMNEMKMTSAKSTLEQVLLKAMIGFLI